MKQQVVEVRPNLAMFRSWTEKEIRALSRLSYEELISLPEEAEIDGPYLHPDVKYFLRRVIHENGGPGMPCGTVEVSVSIEIYEDGQFLMASCPSVEMTPRGRILNPLRGWDRRD